MSGESFSTRQLSQPLWVEVQPRPQRRPACTALTGGEAGTVSTPHKRASAAGATGTHTLCLGGLVTMATGD